MICLTILDSLENDHFDWNMWRDIFSPANLFYCSGVLELTYLHLFDSHFIATTKLTNITLLNLTTDHAVQHYHIIYSCMKSRAY
jgi:hypothetical protein